MSLLEILVVCSLLLVLLALGVQIFLPVLRSYAKSDRKTGLLQKVATSLDRIEGEIADSNVRGIHFVTTPTSALVVQPVGPPGATGIAFWSPELRVIGLFNQELRFHVWRSKNLTQHTISQPYAVLPQEIPDILRKPDNSRLLIAPAVVRFEVIGLEPTVRKLPLTVKLEARLPTGEQFLLSREVLPRSQPSL